MTKILKIDKALYEVDDKTKIYRYFGRNPNWESLGKEENERNKKRINGYTRIFRDGKTKNSNIWKRKAWGNEVLLKKYGMNYSTKGEAGLDSHLKV